MKKKNKALAPTIIATLVATASFVLVNYLRGKPVEWVSALVFIIVFAVFFEITRRLFGRKN